jgi:hypothetical protein
MTTKAIKPAQPAVVQTSAPVAPIAVALPPVPGGGSWRPNAAGDGWLENLPTPLELPISTLQPE